MYDLRIHISPTDNREFEFALSTKDLQVLNARGTVKAEADGTVFYDFSAQYDPARCFHGYIQDEACTWTGTWEQGASSGTFIFKRIAPEIMCFRPSPAAIQANKPQAFWQYAMSAILHQVRRRLFSWSFFRSRRDVRRKYLELALPEHRHMDSEGDRPFEALCVLEVGHPRGRAELDELRCCQQALTTADARFYDTIIKTVPVHL